MESADDVLDIIASVQTVDRGATTTYQLGHAAACVGAFDVSETLFTQAADALRAEGRLHTLGTALALLSWSALHLGHWSTAVLAAAEGGRLCSPPRRTSRPGCGRRSGRTPPRGRSNATVSC